MIDFTQHNTEDQSCDREAYESLKTRAESIGKNLSGDKRSKFRLGAELRDLFNSRDFRTVCAIYYPIGNVRNCSGTVYFRYLKETFDLDRSAVSRLVNVADEFGDENGRCAAEWADFRWSALAEMLPLTPEQRKAVKPSWKREEIRAFKKSLTATTAEDEPTEEAEKPQEQYPQFKGWKRNDFCRHIVDLEAENNALKKQVAALNCLMEKIGEQDSGDKAIDFATLDSILTLAHEKAPA